MVSNNVVQKVRYFFLLKTSTYSKVAPSLSICIFTRVFSNSYPLRMALTLQGTDQSLLNLTYIKKKTQENGSENT